MWLVIATAVGALALVVYWQTRTSDRTPPAATGGTVEVSAGDASRSPGLESLVGRWVRTDYPYVIDIRAVDYDGSVEASYYNPRPIRVARAEVRPERGQLVVTVELRDVNYPGSTYTLVYDRDRDLLLGEYFQAVERQTFAVAFARQRAER